MTEQNLPKKPGLFKRFIKGFGITVKWLFTAALAILLVAGLIFRAPPKALILIAVILTALTIIPKPARKWIWLSFAVIIAVLIVWVFLPDNNQGWRPYTFDEELEAFEAKYAVPDEDNAAIIYDQLLQTFDPNDFDPDYIDDEILNFTLRNPWSTNDFPQMTQFLKNHEDTIIILMLASKQDLCLFQINLDNDTYVKTIDRCSSMRYWTLLLCRSTNNDLGEGRIDTAFEKYITLFKIARHLYQQPILLDMITGMSVEGIAIGQFNSLVVNNKLSESQLVLIDKTVQSIKHDWKFDFLKIIESEILFTKNTFASYYEINENNKIRFARNRQLVLPTCRVKKINYWQKKLHKLMIIYYWFSFPSNPQKFAQVIDNSYANLYEMAKPNYDWNKKPKQFPITSLFSTSAKLNYINMVKWSVDMSEGVYYQIHDLYLKSLARRNATRIMIALKLYKNKHGQWPPSLDDIQPMAPEEIFIDPINGGEFVYKLTDNNFTLYSKGKNNIDEHGQREMVFDPNVPKWPYC